MTRSLLCAVLVAPLVLLPACALAKRHHSADMNGPTTAASTATATIPMVTLTPGPGAHFQIPANWIACDDATEKLLSSAPDSMNIRERFCSRSAAVTSVVRAFDPRPFHTLTVIFDYKAQSPLSEQAVRDIKPSDLEAMRGPICDAVLKPLQRGPNAKVDCDVVLGSLAGHPALVSTVVETDPANPDATYKIVSYEAAYPGGYAHIQIATAVILEKIVRPTLDAILASVHFDAAAMPPPADGATEQHAAPDGDQAQPSASPATPPSTPDSSI